MANRIIYQSDALFVSSGVSSTTSGQHAQLRRVQSANYSFNVNRTDVNQFGQLARIDTVILETPTINVDVSYLLGNGFNEQALGFSRSANFGAGVTGFIKNQIAFDSAQGTSGINMYILTTPEGTDANVARDSATNDYSVIGLGNLYLSDYTLDASVGDFPTVSISMEGLNANATTGVSGSTGTAGSVTGFTGASGVGILPVSGTQLSVFTNSGITFPAPSESTGASIPTALKPGDITLTLENANTKTFYTISGSSNSAHVQSVSLSVPLSRTPIEKLGSTFAFARPVDFPVTPTLSVSAVVNAQNQQAIHDIIADDGFIDSLTIAFATGTTNVAQYQLKNVKLDSESVSSSIGPNKTVDMTFSVAIGGPDDTANNIFFSGAHTDAIFS